MELFFTCPVTGEIFGSAKYVLEKNHGIVEAGDRGRELVGMVDLEDPCPLCGGQHRYAVQDVICPMTRETDDK